MASDRKALRTTIPISTAGQEENLNPTTKLDENRLLMIPRSLEQPSQQTGSTSGAKRCPPIRPVIQMREEFLL